MSASREAHLRRLGGFRGPICADSAGGRNGDPLRTVGVPMSHTDAGRVSLQLGVLFGLAGMGSS